jgi:hypothetical protein
MATLFDRTMPAKGALSPGWRGRLLLAMAAVGLAAFVAGDPAPRLAEDPELARLLRGMAAIKALLTAGVARLLWWRLGRPVSAEMAAGYVLVSAAMAGATVMAWQLSHLALLSIAFHAGLVALGLLAWRDDAVDPLGRRG